MARNYVATDKQEDRQSYVHKWYFNKDEIEHQSPSRKDGIKYEEESYLRKLYCSYLQELGMNLKLPQVTIATAMMFCHRFYMRQSHAKNDWQTVATACVFLASKAEYTPRCLSDLVVVAYKLMYKWDPVAPQRIRQKEIYDKQKDIIILAESLLLATLAFDLNIEQPYKPLVAAVKKLGLSQNDIMKVAWNFVNDWLRTTLCLQYKPYYIAAGSLFLASKLQKVKLPSTKGNAWWMQFDVSPKQLEEVIQQMVKILDQNQKAASRTAGDTVPESKQVNGTVVLSSPESCISDGSVVTPEVRNVSPVEAEGASQSAASACSQEKVDLNNSDNAETERCRPSGCSSTDSIVQNVVFTPKGRECDPSSGCRTAPSTDSIIENVVFTPKGRECDPSSGCRTAPSTDSIVENVVFTPKGRECDPNSGCRTAPMEASNCMIDVYGIKERLKKRKVDRQTEKRSIAGVCDVIESESWIEREIENGIQTPFDSPEKRRRIGTEEIVA